MGNFTVDFLDRMMLLQQDYFNQTIAVNETTRKLFVTGSTSAVVKNFKKRIEQDKDSTVNEKDVLKFFFYSDHDDSIETLATAFGFVLPVYPAFASHIVYELWRQGNKTNGTQSYHVLMRINEANVTLQGPCAQQQVCPIDNFEGLIRQISYYGNQAAYNELCETTLLSSPRQLQILETSDVNEEKQDTVSLRGEFKVGLIYGLLLAAYAFHSKRNGIENKATRMTA